MRKLGPAVLVLAIVLAAIVLQGCGGKQVAGVPETVAKVNGEPISSNAYIQELSRMDGQQVLRSLIEQQIMINWAKDQGVAVTDKQIQDQIDVLKFSGEYDEGVKQLGEEGLDRQLRFRQAQANVASKLYKISDKDLRQLFDNPQVKTRYSHGPQKQIVLIINSDKAKAEKAAKELKAGGDMDSVAAKYALSGKANTLWIDPSQKGLPAPIADAVKNTADGKVSSMVELPPYQQYGVFKVTGTRGAGKLSFAEAKPELTILAAGQAMQTHPDFQKKLQSQTKAAKIQIDIPQLKGLAEQIKSPSALPPGMGGPMPGG